MENKSLKMLKFKKKKKKKCQRSFNNEVKTEPKSKYQFLLTY